MKVSVCIPVYGVEKHIERCARSLFEQTMKDGIEFIFVNDCTKDKSIEVLEKILEEYPERKEQVKIIHHEVNKGQLGARNTALQHVSGDYIIHCDSDDWVDLDLYETMYQKAVSEQADVVLCSILIERGHKIPYKWQYKCKTVNEMFLQYFNTALFCCLCNKMFRRSIALNAAMLLPDDHIPLGEDLLISTKMFLNTSKMVVCDEIYYHYFFNNPDSITLNLSHKTFISSVKVAEALEKVLPEKYQDFNLALRGQALFSALSVQDVSAEEFFTLYGKRIIPKILFAKRLSFDKRMLVNIALISYPLAKFLCSLRVRLVNLIRS